MKAETGVMWHKPRKPRNATRKLEEVRKDSSKKPPEGVWPC